jgi:GNAT superfamily N-acetyltransferase
MTEAARLATLDDLDRLAELAAVAVPEQAGDRGGAIWSVREARELPADDTLRRDLLDDDTLVLAGTIDEVVVGYAVATTEVLRDGRQLGRITDLYVEAPARAVGVGECLADAVVAWCTAQGCSGIDALALPGNRETKNFFETFGFTARAIVVHRSLP